MCQLPGHPTNSKCCEKIVGIDARNKDSISETYICQICALLMREPVQLFCGHRFCQSCINVEESSMIKCIKCNEETRHDKVMPDRGFRQDMETVQIFCSFCDWNGIFKNYQDHLNTIHPRLSCEYCDKAFLTTDTLIQHQTECDKMIVSCKLKPYGCTEQFIRINTKSHLLTEKHQSVLLSILSRTKSHLTNDQQLVSSQMDLDLPHTTISNFRTTNDQLYETIDVLLGGIQVLSDETRRINSESLSNQCSLQSLSGDLSNIKIATEETNIFLEGLESNQKILGQDVSSLKQQIDDQRFTSYDGTFMWKITGVQEKIDAAKSETQTSIYSPPFYSSSSGYKMRARLYLHGDGNARRTHMSLFFVLMRGENDAILTFPFNFKVTFCLYDQTTEGRNIIDSFRPDIKSNSFQRPQSEMNIATGIPKFCPLAAIQQDNNPYIRSDTMFIKVMVDFANLPKTILPYVLTINQGLPALVRQIMIKQESDKRAQQQTITTDTSMNEQIPTLPNIN